MSDTSEKCIRAIKDLFEERLSVEELEALGRSLKSVEWGVVPNPKHWQDDRED